MITNKNHTVLYTGVTNDLDRRLYEHKHKILKGFSSRYNVSKLVYYEYYEQVDEAITREKEIKGLSRAKKNQLIQSTNPEWKDLTQN